MGSPPSPGSATRASSRASGCRRPTDDAPDLARCLQALVERIGVGARAQGAADHEALDFARALEDREELGVAVPLLDGEVLDVAPPAHGLDRLLAGAHRDLGGLQLRHRALGVLE